MTNIPKALMDKYNVPVPRYTSYPTLPHWKEGKMIQWDWQAKVKKAAKAGTEADGISLYLHLPYCEALCTYCACNKRITKNHGVEKPYIEALLKEWAMYRELFDEPPVIREIHLGGGTPTFFSPENLRHLMENITETSNPSVSIDYSFEGHPNNTTKEHLQQLYAMGFRRVSFGVQDLDTTVQKAINRIQPYDRVEQVMDTAREIGYTSVNIDLIYGLPFQTEASVRSTIEQVIMLKPERIAFYSYAHVPWKGTGQRAYSKMDLPNSESKRKLYEIGKQLFLKNDYLDIGMDHFAVAGDPLNTAFRNKMMHRNFMGYTPHSTTLLVGLGASAISDADTAYAQNIKNIEEYIQTVHSGRLPLSKGHCLSEDEIILRTYIMDILCKGEVCWRDRPDLVDINAMIGLHTMAKEGLIKLYDTGLRVTDIGMPFIRNICAMLDPYLQKDDVSMAPKFSVAI